MKIANLEQRRKYQQYVLAMLGTIRPQIIFILATLLLGLLLGLTDLLHTGELTGTVAEQLLSKFRDYRGIELFFRIFSQNARATAIILYSGFFLSLTPTLASLANGMIIGHVVVQFSGELSPVFLAVSLLPHGVFEIPALVIAFALGTRFGLWPFRPHRIATIKSNSIRFTQYYFFVIIPLLLIAALIETAGIEAQRFFLQ